MPDQGVSADLLPRPPETIAEAQTLAPCLAVDASNVYWVDQLNGTRVVKAPITGLGAGGTPQPIATDVSARSCVVIDAAWAYFATPSTDADAGVGDTIWRAPLDGSGDKSPIATGQHVKAKPVVQGGYLYWATDVYGDGEYTGSDAVVRLPLAGLDESSGPSNDKIEVLFADLVPEPAGLAVDGTNVYWSDNAGVFSRPLANLTAQPTSFGDSTIHGNTFAVDGASGHLALVEVMGLGTGGDVALLDLDGTGRKVISASLASSPLALDNSGVYAKVDAQLVRIALDGKSSTVLALAAPRALALDASFVYFTDGAAILKLPK